jgi:hypothetical protein
MDAERHPSHDRPSRHAQDIGAQVSVSVRRMDAASAERDASIAGLEPCWFLLRRGAR